MDGRRADDVDVEADARSYAYENVSSVAVNDADDEAELLRARARGRMSCGDEDERVGRSPSLPLSRSCASTCEWE